MDQRGRLERLAGQLLRQPLGGQPAQFIVDQRQQPAGPGRVALPQGAQQLRDGVYQPPMIPGPGSACQQAATKEELLGDAIAPAERAL
jgi:hypothetical protein